MITITNEDNMQLMARYPDKYFDLAIVDLEYYIGASKPSIKPNFVKQKNGSKIKIKKPDYNPKEWDLKMSTAEYFEELFRVSKNQIIFGGNYYGLPGGYLIWNKINGESDQFGAEMAWLSFTKRTDIVHYMWSGMFQGKYCGFDFKKALIQQGDKSKNEVRIHPTQKPVRLYKWILDNYIKQLDLSIDFTLFNLKILDTHFGSGSLGEACHDMGFDLTACELDKEYYDKAILRLKNHQMQTKINF